MLNNKCLKFIFGFSLFFCLAFLSVPSVKADSINRINTSYQSLVSTIGGVATFSNYVDPTCGNNLVLVTFITRTYNSFSNAYYNGVTMTNLGLGLHQDDYVRSRTESYYLQNVTSGTHSFSIQSGSDPVTAIISTYCNVNPITPIQSSSWHFNAYLSTSINSGYFDITSDNSLVIMNIFPYLPTPGSISVTPSSGITSYSGLLNSYDYGEYFQGFDTSLDISSNNQFGASMNVNGSIGEETIVLNYQSSTYCGDTICNGSETCSTCSSDCGTCISNPYSNDTSLFFFSSPYVCTPAYVANFQYTYNTSVFTAYDYIEIDKISSDWASTTAVSTSSPVANDPGGSGVSTFSFDCGDYGVMPLGISQYQAVAHFSGYYDSGSGQDVSATSSIPYVFSVNNQSNVTTIIPPNPVSIVNSTSSLLTTNAHDWACTADEWATPSPTINWFGMGTSTIPAFNFTLLGCQRMEVLFQFIDHIKYFVSLVVGGLKDEFLNVFPFNLVMNVVNSYKQSAYTTLPDSLSWLDMSDSSGNIHATIPKQLLHSSTDYSFLIFGADMFGTSTSTPRLFIAHFRGITPFLSWLALLFAVIYLGHSIYEDLSNKIHKDK